MKLIQSHKIDCLLVEYLELGSVMDIDSVKENELQYEVTLESGQKLRINKDCLDDIVLTLIKVRTAGSNNSIYTLQTSNGGYFRHIQASSLVWQPNTLVCLHKGSHLAPVITH